MFKNNSKANIIFENIKREHLVYNNIKINFNKLEYGENFDIFIDNLQHDDEIKSYSIYYKNELISKRKLFFKSFKLISGKSLSLSSIVTIIAGGEI